MPDIATPEVQLSTAALERRAADFAAHGSFSGRHSHAHSPYGEQGDDATHEHEHSHDGDNRHDHAHGASGAHAHGAEGMHTHDEAGAVVAAAEGGLTTASSADPLAAALAAFAMAGAPSLVQVGGTMVIEDEQTGDGRLVATGAITWCDPPLPFAWLQQEQHGDLSPGAVQVGTVNVIWRDAAQDTHVMWAGTIDTAIADGAEMVRRMMTASAPLGQRWGVSIDPDDWAVELVDTNPPEAGDEGGMILLMASGTGAPPNWTRPLTAAAGEPDPGGTVVMEDSADSFIARYTRMRVRGLTACAVAAFAGADMALGCPPGMPGMATDNSPTAEPDADAAAAAAPGTTITVTLADGSPQPDPAPEPMRAAATAARPLAVRTALDPEWFADPEFRPGDGRMVRQPNGRFACPHTVTEDGRVFGHVASWYGRHNAFSGRQVMVPRSQTGYAAFHRTPLQLDDGTLINVGTLTMGIGHDERETWSLDSVTAHYDGGPDATRACYARVGEDQYGPWYAGALIPGLSTEHAEQFAACGVSGDWRQVWQGKGLDLVAVLAGVYVPGFTISRLAAAGFAPMELPANLRLPQAAHAVYDARGEVRVLTAAGMVAPMMPWDRQLADQQGVIEMLTERVRKLEVVAAPLRASAARLYAGQPASQ